MRCFNTVIICYYCFQITLLPMTNPKQYMSGENMMHSNVSDHPRKSQLNVSLMSSPRLDVLTKTGGKLRHSSYSATKRRKARRDGNVIIGALFPVHHRPPIQTAYSRVCGLIREYYGIQRIETFLRTIDQINSNASILPHITLGWDIRDSCWYSAIALEQSIDFVQDAIASQTANADEAIVNDIDGETSVNEMANTPQLGKNAKQFANKSRCVEQRNKPIVGLVGPGSSEASIQVQNLLQIFNIPQIGYSATSMDLSDKNTYRYFLRVVPPDYYQVQVLVDILLAFNWTYISTVHSDGNYGIRGMEMFTDLASSYNICVATTDTVASSDRDHEFDQVVTRLQLTQQASVVVCFCEGITVKKLLSAIKRKDVYGKFLIIGSDGWGNRLDVVMGQEDVAVGGISVKLYSPPIPHFSHYYASLKPNESQNWNPWFNEFWQEKFQCYLPGEDRDMRFWNRCSGDETLKDSDQDSKLGFVVNAVTTMALALHDMSEDLCPEYRGLCPKMNPINGTLFLNYLLNVSFESYSGHYVHFDKNGDPPGRYEILNYQPIQQIGNKTIYDYVTIGQWMSGNIQLNEQSIFWPNRGKNVLGQFRSVCSEPCRSGFVKRGVGSARIQCCWVCTACKDNEIVVDEARCSACNQGWWPNEQKSGCDEITVEYINWRNTWSIMATAIACTGLLLTVWVTVIFIRSQNTAVVKASTRELSYILLLGISLAFSSNFVIFSKPFKVGCYLLRIIPGLAFSMMYGALVTRTNRIARILEGRKRITTKKPRFMSAAAQVFFTAVIIAVECIILIVMFFVEPANITMDYSVSKKVRLICKSSVLGVVGPMAFDFFLIMMCTLYAVKTRNLPENFNEAKFIGFTMYTTCVIWLAFLPIYFGANYKEITMSVSISCSAGIALLLLFLPKVCVCNMKT